MAKVVLKTRMSNKTKLGYVLRISKFLEISEAEFSKIIRDLEKDPIFLWLKDQKIIRYRKRRKFFYSPLEHITVIENRSLPIINEILTQHRKTIVSIKKIGEEKFRRYFLYPDKTYNYEEIRKDCSLNNPQIQDIFRLMDILTLHADSLFQSSLVSVKTGKKRYSKLGFVERTGKNLSFSFFNPLRYAGMYDIKHEILRSLKKTEKYGKIKEIIGKVERSYSKKTEKVFNDK